MEEPRKFDLIHGHEVHISQKSSTGKIQVDVKEQTSADTFMQYRLVFETQTQIERLFYPIMKGLRNNSK